MSEIKLSSKVIDGFMYHLLLKEEEYALDLEGVPTIFADMVKIEGFSGVFGFHHGRLQEIRNDIIELLSQLPKGFREEEEGYGSSVMNACMDKDGRQWGEQRDVDLLFCMSMALGLVSYSEERILWKVLPGGMPFAVIHTKEQPVDIIKAGTALEGEDTNSEEVNTEGQEATEQSHEGDSKPV